MKDEERLPRNITSSTTRWKQGEIILQTARSAGAARVGYVRNRWELKAYFPGEATEEEAAFVDHCLAQAHVEGVWVVGLGAKV